MEWEHTAQEMIAQEAIHRAETRITPAGFSDISAVFVGAIVGIAAFAALATVIQMQR